MRLLIPVEARLTRDHRGHVWVKSPSHYGFWSRYLGPFDEVRLLARTSDSTNVANDWNRVDGAGVSVASLPFYVGPTQYARRYSAIRRQVQREVEQADALLLRIPGQISGMAMKFRRTGQPMGVEVVGDPDTVFAPGVIDHPLRPILRKIFTRRVKAAAAQADTAAYVTREALQAKYPATNAVFATHYSSVELPSDAFLPARSKCRRDEFTVVTVGSLDQPYKGIDTLLRATAEARSLSGNEVMLTIVGDGRLRPEYEGLARDLGIRSAVRFTGQVPAGDAVRQQLDASDLFVLASLSEGLPRAMIEAMARGLPCLGSSVGGIPELLPPEQMFAPGDWRELARLITALHDDLDSYRSAADQARVVAQGYSASHLQERRVAHYVHLGELAERWSAQQQVR